MKHESTVVAILVGVSVGVLVDRWLQRDSAPKISLQHLAAFAEGMIHGARGDSGLDASDVSDVSVDNFIPAGWGIQDGELTTEMKEAIDRAKDGNWDIGAVLGSGEILESGSVIHWRALASDDPQDDGGIVIFRREKAASA